MRKTGKKCDIINDRIAKMHQEVLPMKIIRAKDYKDMSRKAANIISAQVIMKPNCVLGLVSDYKIIVDKKENVFVLLSLSLPDRKSTRLNSSHT